MPKKILIAEDDLTSAKLTTMALRHLGHVLVQATDGEEALSMVDKELPDLLILDINLPKINGIEIAKRLKQSSKFKNMPILAVTAYAMKGDGDRIKEAGCDYYMTKPSDIHELARVVANILR